MENIYKNNEVYSNQLLSNKFSCHLPLGATKFFFQSDTYRCSIVAFYCKFSFLFKFYIAFGVIQWMKIQKNVSSEDIAMEEIKKFHLTF